VGTRKSADSRARALASTLRELRAAGFVSRQALADELSRRRIPTARGGRWQYTTVVRMLTSGKGARANNGQTGKRAADARAKALASTIRKLQAKGLVSFNAIAHALNEREIPTPLGGNWHPATVRRLLQRLKNFDRTSRSRHRR
jgi:hypothetical protein